MNRFLYFRNVADEDDDDGADASVMIPVNNITGFYPYNNSHMYDTGVTSGAANKLEIYYKSLKNETVNEYVKIDITQGSSKAVIAAIVSAMTNKVNGDGITVVADDSTTDYNDSAKKAVYLHKDILSVNEIIQG